MNTSSALVRRFPSLAFDRLSADCVSEIFFCELIKVVTVSTKLLYPISINFSVLKPEQIGINYYKYERQSRAAASSVIGSSFGWLSILVRFNANA
jgi:hypothetical protein